MLATFVAALESVGTAATLAGGGFYLHRRGFVSTEGKKVLARYSQQIAIPALFLSRLIGCGNSPAEEEAACPSIWDEMSALWILFVWPIYVIGVGLVVGSVACAASNTPKGQRPSINIAVACSNSFSLPITLLSVFEDSGVVPGGDATSYLSMYVILQFVLMWGMGGYFLTPVDSDRAMKASPGVAIAGSMTRHGHSNNMEPSESAERTSLLSSGGAPKQQPSSVDNMLSRAPSATILHHGIVILSKALQPPVVAAIVGLAIAGMPRIRFLLVEESPGDQKAALAWLFRGVVSTGKSAVPVGMAVLGVNLSMAAHDSSAEPNLSCSSSRVSPGTIIAVILSRMVLMPILGIGSVFLLSQVTGTNNATSTTNMASFYLVLMIVFITPTANSVLIMVELADGMREGIATILAWQYLLSPVILTCSIAAVLHVAVSI
jgi:predicted permease